MTTTHQRLGLRWLVTRETHRGEGLTLLNPRHAISFLRGPMTRAELVRVRELHAGNTGDAAEAARKALRLVGGQGETV